MQGSDDYYNVHSTRVRQIVERSIGKNANIDLAVQSTRDIFAIASQNLAEGQQPTTS